MRKLLFPVVLSVILLAGVFGMIQIAKGQAENLPAGMEVLKSEADGENLREVYVPDGYVDGPEPEISFIDSPSATCFQPDLTKDSCQINWYYLSVDANPNYMIAMTVTLNTIGPVARVGGFFQTSMYIPYNMLDRGFTVPCGAPGAGGIPSLGNAYAYTINARDSSNLKSANYGTLYCPAYTP